VSYFVYCFTVGLPECLDEACTFTMLSDIFKGNWLYDGFPTRLHLHQVFTRHLPILPRRVPGDLPVHRLLLIAAPHALHVTEAPFHTLRFTKVVSTSRLAHIYRMIQKEDVGPVLIVSQSACEELSGQWNHLRRVQKDALAFYQEAQLIAFDIVAAFCEFEPEGLCCMTFAQMATQSSSARP
jgi:hypothetical protein